jgi:hypothetical protein
MRELLLLEQVGFGEGLQILDADGFVHRGLQSPGGDPFSLYGGLSIVHY